MRKSFWSIEWTPLTLITVAACVAINYIGKFLAGVVSLPLWLDSVGTIVAGLVAGPLGAAITGTIDNIIYGYTLDPVSYAYAVTSIAIGITVGALKYLGMVNGVWKTALSGVILAIVASVVSAPINIYFWGGLGGNVFGDAVFVKLVESGISIWPASVSSGLMIDIPDKILSIFIAVLLLRLISKDFFREIFPDK